MDRLLEPFVDWERSRHEYAKEWRERTGGKVLGYLCTYIPEEILYAANVLPVRIYGSHESEEATDPPALPMFCPFSRDSLAQGLKGKYSYLDGIVLTQSCLHMRQTFNSWTKQIPSEFSYYLPMPTKAYNPFACDYFTEELVQFKESIEGWVRREITNEDLGRGIELVNENRRLLHEMYDLRKADNPPITGEEVLEVVLSSQLTDKREHNEALRRLLEGVEKRTIDRVTGPRLMMVTSEFDDIPLIHMVESLGATCVVDEHCTGTRYFWNMVDGGADPVRSIAERYVERPPCPTKDFEMRTESPHIVNLARDYRVQGAILGYQKCCDPYESHFPIVEEQLKKNGIPSLVLEFDTTNPPNRFRDGIRAFIEKVGKGSLLQQARRSD